MKDKTITYQWVFGIVATLFIVVTTWVYFVKGHINLGDIEFTKLGTYGDFIGGLLGTILSIVAVILVYKTYISQSRELELNRKLLEQQSFENTFFNMLKVHQDLKNNISFSTSNLLFRKYYNALGSEGKGVSKPIEVNGREFLNLASDDFKNLFNANTTTHNNYLIKDNIQKELKDYKYDGILNKPISPDDHLEHIQFKYDLFFQTYGRYLGDYFRNLYHILNFISKKKSEEIIDNPNKIISINKYQQYADILQSQMSFSELLLNFYNASKYPKMKELINEFDFLENLHVDNLLDISHKNLKGFGKIKTD